MTSNAPEPMQNARTALLVRVAAQTALILVAFVLGGVVSGFLWHAVWDAPTGVVFNQQWNITSEDGLRASFSATGWFVVISAGFGLALGLATGLLTRERELVSLAALVLGSAVAAVVMWRLGMALSAPDPDVLARRAAEGTLLEGRMAVGGWSPGLAFPTASLFGILIPFILIPGKEKSVFGPAQDSGDVAEPLPSGPFHP